MNSGLAHTIDSLFGPASELIDVDAFIESEKILYQDTISNQSSSTIADECSISDICDSLYNVWNNPTLSGTLVKDHEHTITALHAANLKKLRKAYSTTDSPLPEVSDLQKSIKSVSLTSWRLDVEAATFLRKPKNSDHNVLEQVKTTSGQSTAIDTPQALLTVSVHTRVSWGPSYVNRSSQHVFLSSQNLQDLCTTIPCISSNLPTEAGFESENLADDEEAQFVICIEGVLYGDENGNDGYADKLLKQIEILKKKPAFSVTKAPTSLKQTTFSSLSLRLNDPYWLIHKGNCEHFIVIDQIRLLHPSDPKIGYPLTVQITPSLLDLCRACSKVPAVWSIVGDVRLGENPCVMCDPCWKCMGESEEEGVVALPLPNAIV